MGSLISTILSAYKASLDTSRERYQKAISKMGKTTKEVYDNSIEYSYNYGVSFSWKRKKKS